MIVDSHIHTEVSSDSHLVLADAIRQADKLGIGITLTEHIDLGYPVEGMFTFDRDEYFARYGQYKSDRVRLGVEIGMQTVYTADNRSIAEAHPFDYVLGSIHMVDGIDIYNEEFYHGKPKKMTYGRYFESMIDCLKSDTYIDALAHIDYICRYARYDDTEIEYRAFADYIDEVLHLVIEREIALELNTRRLYTAPQAAYMLDTIYRRYYDLGGRLVTIGSDAHKAEAVGWAVSDAMALIDRWKLRPVYYENRRPHDMK